MTDTPWITPDYYVAPANYADEVKAKVTLPPRIVLHDSTLRDGEGTPGVIFKTDEKTAIAKKLDEVGVPEIEAGHTGDAVQEELDAITAVAHLDLRAEVWCMSSWKPECIENAINCGVKGVVLSVPSGTPTLRSQGVTEQQTRQRGVDGIKRIKDSGRKAVFFSPDSTRAELSFYKSLIAEVVESGQPDAVALVDTRGVTSPEAVAYLIEQIKSVVSVPIQMHAHNDLGLGVANALAALKAGATTVHTCVYGLGERCGNTPMEPLALALKLLHDRDLGLKMSEFYSLARLVSECSGVAIPPSQPVLGDFAWVRMTGGLIETLKKDPTNLFPYHPAIIGRQADVWLGKVSGTAAIVYKLENLGLTASEAQVKEMLAIVQDRSVAERRCIRDDEFAQIAKQVIG